ncbi:MAG: phage holin family protein [Succinatimonas hippei]|nr:phage holin family protein [Succinatimonas hippei]
MDEFKALLPYCAAALIALIVAFCRSTIANVPPTVKLRIFDAIVCAAGALSVCVVAGNHFSEYMAHGDSIAVAFAFGYLGAGRLSDFALTFAEKKLGGKS